MLKNDIKKINILYVDENQDGTTGGSHYSLLDLVRHMDKSKFNLNVMFYESNRIIEDFIKEPVHVVIYRKLLPITLLKKADGKIKKSNIYTIPIRVLQLIINNIRTSLIPFIYFIWFILKNKIQIVHLNNSVFTFFEWVIACKLLRRKILVHQRSHFNKISPYLRWPHKYYDYILGISEWTKKYLSENGVSLKNYATFYNRIDVEKLYSKITKTRRETRKEFLITETQPVIGIVGNLQPWKGQLTVVRSINLLQSKYPEIKCLLVGDHSTKIAQYYHELVKHIDKYGIKDKIIFTGFREDIPNLVSALDIFIHASISPEPFGRVVLEAMSLGKAVIASNEGGPVEMIENNISGILIDPGNPEVLAEKIDMLLSDPEAIERVGANAKQRVHDKFMELDIKFIEELYQKLITIA